MFVFDLTTEQATPLLSIIKLISFVFGFDCFKLVEVLWCLLIAADMFDNADFLFMFESILGVINWMGLEDEEDGDDDEESNDMVGDDGAPYANDDCDSKLDGYGKFWDWLFRVVMVTNTYKSH